MKLDTVEAAGWLKRMIDSDRPAKVFVDVGGVDLRHAPVRNVSTYF